MDAITIKIANDNVVSVSLPPLQSFGGYDLPDLNSIEASPLAPHFLRTNYLEDPIAIDTLTPRFTWRVQHKDKAEAITAYRIRVASTRNIQDSLIWDSGKMNRPNSYALYGGMAVIM